MRMNESKSGGLISNKIEKMIPQAKADKLEKIIDKAMGVVMDHVEFHRDGQRSVLNLKDYLNNIPDGSKGLVDIIKVYKYIKREIDNDAEIDVLCHGPRDGEIEIYLPEVDAYIMVSFEVPDWHRTLRGILEGLN